MCFFPIFIGEEIDSELYNIPEAIQVLNVGFGLNLGDSDSKIYNLYHW